MGATRGKILAGITALAVLPLLGVKPRAAAATPEVEAAAEQDPATRAARRHFQSGIKLYRDANYSGALAEFEAAYREKPGPGSLQNVALSLKALFRYAEASEALRMLLDRHSAELGDGERKAVRDAITELEALVGTLRVQVNPSSASVSVNGRELSNEERLKGVKLNVGEHLIVAEAPGYAQTSRIVRIAGQQSLLADVVLKATSGFLKVVTNDDKAAIAVDGEPRGFKSWSGPVTPEVEHLVQIYREGFEPFERSVRVTAGQLLRVDGSVGPRTGSAAVELPPSNPNKAGAPPAPRTATGPYGLLALSVLGLNNEPLGLQVGDASEANSLSTIGLRAGYRLSEPIAVEAAIDAGQLAGNNVCQANQEDETVCDALRDFTLTSLRFGPNLRLFTSGETLRFAVGLGVGAVLHRIDLDAATASNGARLEGGMGSGLDPYFSFEIGGAFNYRHLLAELSLMAFVEGADNLSGAFDEGDERGVFSDGTLPMLGLGLKLGYSAWSPRR
jgi:hypothetical protein